MLTALLLTLSLSASPSPFKRTLDETVKELLWETSDDVSWWCEYERCDLV